MDVTGVQIDLVAGCEGGRWRSALVIILCHVVLHFGQCRPCLVKRALHAISELIYCFNLGWRLVWFEAHPRVSASVEEERCLLCGGVDMVVVCELGDVPTVLLDGKNTQSDQREVN